MVSKLSEKVFARSMMSLPLRLFFVKWMVSAPQVDLGEVLEAGLIGPAPLVDGLPWIAYYEYASVPAYKLDQLLMSPVYVLILVDQKMRDMPEGAWLFLEVLDAQADHSIIGEALVLSQLGFVQVEILEESR